MPRDYYAQQARRKGYRSRAAYKLKQINDKYSVIKGGDVIVDLGCAPGGWCQVARELAGKQGKVVGVDLKPMKPLPGVSFVRGDMGKEHIREAVSALIEKADVVLCDASPRISGIDSVDQARIFELAEHALVYAEKLLRSGGTIVVKAFQGERVNEFRSRMKKMFRFCKPYVPKATKKGSREFYLVGKGFKS